MLNHLHKYSFLILQLVSRDLKVKYRRSFLGVLWSVLNPLLSMTVLSIVFSQFFRFDLPYYPVYLITGQIIFNFFSESTNLAMFSIKENASLIKKVAMPVYIFPVSRIISSLMNLFFSFIAVLIVVLFMKYPVTPALLFLPIPVLYIFLFSTGVGLVLGAVSVYFRDIVHLYGVFLTLVVYLTPIFYPYQMIPDQFKYLIEANPLTYFVACFRSLIYDGTIPSLKMNFICILCCVLSLLIGAVVFKKLKKNFILYF